MFLLLCGELLGVEPTTGSIAKAIKDQSIDFEKQSVAIEAAYLFQVFSSDGTISQSNFIEYSASPKRILFVVRKQNSLTDVGTLNYVATKNDQYSFHLLRKGNEWALTELASTPSTYERQYNDMERPFALAGMRSTYRQLLESGNTRLVSATKVDWRGSQRYELIFDTTMPTAREAKSMRRRYGFFVLPEHPGVVSGTRIYDPADPANWLLEDVIEYDYGAKPLARLKSVDVYATDKTSGYKPWRVQHIEVARYRGSQSPLPDRMFTLTAFGLPEPKTIPKATELFTPPSSDINMVTVMETLPEKGTSLWFWLGLVLLVGIIVISWLWYRRFRNQADIG